MENQHHIERLLADYLNQQITREEFDQLFSELAAMADEEVKIAILGLLNNQTETVDAAFIEERVASLYPQLQTKLTQPAKRPISGRLIRWSATVAAVILVFLVGWLTFFDKNENNDEVTAITPEQILPGANRATLTLADGRVIDLNTEQNGIIVGEEITYRDGSSVLREHVSQLALSTPRGGQYEVTLPDGTNVWLNAASKLEYPSRFTDEERVVRLEGEAYFAVAKDDRKPFRVVCAQQEIEVLGTEFNISAYPDESEIKTTLVEGSVSLKTDHRPATTLKPNQQAILHKGVLDISNVDVSAAIAWKNGLFNFHGLTLDDALKQVERWYDVKVRYEEGKRPKGYLGGKMSRGVKLSTFLDFLEQDFQIKAELKPDQTLVLRSAE